MTRVTQLVAGIPVTDLGAAIAWYTGLLGRPPDMRVGDEVLWDVAEGATVFIEPDPHNAGAGRITMVVAELDAVLARLDAGGVAHGA
ncbi:MAG: VOC family protein, partial [Thermoleophilia bacterium]